MIRPLDGITVLSFEHAVAAPFCTRQLADLGARVIKVERPSVGDFARSYDERVNGLASHFVWINRSKESLTLDLKSERAAEILERILPEVDVLVQNLAPGAAARLGLSFEALHEKYPQLIVCDISGYGEGGSYEQKKAYDLLIQSESGFVSVTGSADEMAKAGCSIADISAGMYAYSNILSALILRGRTGKGSHIDVSMLESMVEWMGFPMYYAFDGAEPPKRAGAAHAAIYPYGPFPVAGGENIMLGLQNEREWKVFCEQVLKQPELADDPRFNRNSQRTENRDELKAIIIETFSGLSKSEVIELLEGAKIANAAVNTMHDVWNHQQLKERNRWRDVGTSAGTVPALLPPGVNNAYEYRMGDVPALGEHSQSILKEIGYDAEQIEQLTQLGTI
ncbi:MAG: CoA transferase [Alcaligenaceae bacterium]|nr:CoA transferase [Alcaligenaceae bacterium]